MPVEWIRVGEDANQIPPDMAHVLVALGVKYSDKGFALPILKQTHKLLAEVNPRRYATETLKRPQEFGARLQALRDVLAAIPAVVPVVVEELAEEEPETPLHPNPQLFKGVYAFRAKFRQELGPNNYYLSSRAFNGLIRRFGSELLGEFVNNIDVEVLASLTEESILAGRHIGPTILAEIKALLKQIELDFNSPE